MSHAPDPAESPSTVATEAPPQQPADAPGAAPDGAPNAPPPVPPGHRRWLGKPNRTPDQPCRNCGDTTVGWFCPACGQRKLDMRISLRRMLMDAIDDQLSVNSTLPRTLGALLFRPGRLTLDYVQGRMVRYIPPFRLYLVSSLLFFIGLSVVADPRQIALSEESQARADSLRALRIADSVLLVHARATGEDTTALARQLKTRARPSQGRIQFGPNPDSAATLVKPIARRMKAVETRLNSMPRQEALRTLIEAIEENAPVGVFVMMPLFALILKMLYVRRKRFYVEHFVFALHVHAFAFLTGVLVMLSPWDGLDAALLVWFLVYLFLALKKVYEQGILRTAAKYVMLGISYSFLLIFGVTATVLLTALSLG